MQNSYYAPRISRYLRQAEASFAAQRYRDCIRQAEQAERFEKRNPNTFCWRALSHMSLGSPAEAHQILAQAQALFPDNARVRVLAGKVLMDLGHYEAARAVLEAALTLDPSIWMAWANYSTVLYTLQDYQGAKDAIRRALEIEPADPGLLSNYANTLKETGAIAESLAVQRQAVAAAPTELPVRSNLLYTMMFDEATTPQDLLREAQACAALMLPPGSRARPLQAPADTGRIRLGMLSNDLYAHACAYFIIPFLANLDHTRVEVFVYALNGRKDNITQKIQGYAEHFIDISATPADRIPDLIREAQLDVLIDMGGYSRNSPLQYMAHRLAPRQLTWIGYPGSTGLDGIDYRLVDNVTDPDGHEAYHTEKLLRAPVVSAAYFPLVGRPLDAYAMAYRPRPTPALENGHITFGCSVNLAKISGRTLRMWNQVLARCPGSKLLLECAGLDRDPVREPLLARMAQAGIDSERVICIPRRGENQYLIYHSIDIVLDTSPVTGGTNACDALWMGVPVVTFAGQASHERIAASIVASVGLAGLGCTTEAQYVDTAVSLAADVAQLNALRLSVRQMFEASPLFDAATFCRWFEGEIADWAGSYRQPGQVERPAGDGVFFGGRWHRVEEIIVAVIATLQAGDTDGLANVLENISAKWSKHWLVAYALSEGAYRQGDAGTALELLIESATLRKYSLPLYRLLLARLDECGQDKTVLADFLQQAFGLDLAFLEAQPLPSMHEIAGIPAQPEAAAA
ncbi:tetratricopeptide repeat protein [Cupriavidus necator]|uniref:O-linked N-acetylglucosamine transferase, SPINDLY family protein n=1 Tax=Cupriavidus necator TaxID=106590 RepID=UPI0005B3252E|nr:tetratricopeptide repeat protein [Cupriavidus necator]